MLDGARVPAAAAADSSGKPGGAVSDNPLTSGGSVVSYHDARTPAMEMAYGKVAVHVDVEELTGPLSAPQAMMVSAPVSEVTRRLIGVERRYSRPKERRPRKW